MIKATTPSFEIPNEMRAVAERSVEQAKLAFNNYMQAAQEAVATFEERVKASQVGAQGISKKAMGFAERNVLSAFEFAQKLVHTLRRLPKGLSRGVGYIFLAAPRILDCEGDRLEVACVCEAADV